MTHTWAYLPALVIGDELTGIGIDVVDIADIAVVHLLVVLQAD